MASRADVVMAQFDANVSEEERKMQKRIEDSKTIRSLDNITAMSEGAKMGQEIGSTVSSIGDGMKAFRFRSKARKEHISKEKSLGKSGKEARQSWRSSGKKEAKDFYGGINKDDGLSHKTMVSMYLEGVNDNPSGDGPAKPPSNIKNYPEFVGPNQPGQGFVGPVQGSSTTEDNSWYLGKHAFRDGTKGQKAAKSLYDWWND